MHVLFFNDDVDDDVDSFSNDDDNDDVDLGFFNVDADDDVDYYPLRFARPP